jgi:molybdenum cofactor cytidylyltransferase
MANQTQRTPQVAAIVLAAGGSTRMGQLKQLLPIDGQPMVRHTVQAVSHAGLDQVVVVVGAEAEAVRQALAGLPVEVVTNPAWAEGLSTSLQVGIQALRPEIEATFVVLADQPALTPGLLKKLADHYRARRAPIVAPTYEGRRGNPVLLARTLFAELLAISGDRGARDLIQSHQAELEPVAIDDEAVILDLDTPQDYDKFRGKEDEP